MQNDSTLWGRFEQAWNDETAPIELCEQLGELIYQTERTHAMTIYIYADFETGAPTAELINPKGKTIAKATGDEAMVRNQIEQWKARYNPTVFNSYQHS